MMKTVDGFSRFFVVVTAGIIVSGLALKACTPLRTTESKRGAATTSARAGAYQMITSHQAIEAAWSAVKATGAGDIVVELRGADYHGTISFATAAERRSDHVVEVVVNAESGRVSKIDDKGSVPALHGRSATDGWQNFISAKRAYDIALGALEGFREYDENGRLTIELSQDVYYVTFPLLITKETGSRRADFAMQVQVDARTGKVLKVLAAS